MKKTYDIIYRIFMTFCQLMFATSICVTSYVVFARYFLQFTPRWGEQLILLCMVYMALISASLAIRKETHIRVTVLDLFMPKKFIKFLKYASHFLIIAFSVFMIVDGLRFVVLMGKSSMSGLPVKQSFLYAAVPLAGLAMLIMESEKLILFFHTWFKKPLPRGYCDTFQVLTDKELRELAAAGAAGAIIGEEMVELAPNCELQNTEGEKHGE